MALGKQSGEFSYKVTSTTYSETSAQINLHGTATGWSRCGSGHLWVRTFLGNNQYPQTLF
jgi:hypothetical protein